MQAKLAEAAAALKLDECREDADSKEDDERREDPGVRCGGESESVSTVAKGAAVYGRHDGLAGEVKECGRLV